MKIFNFLLLMVFCAQAHSYTMQDLQTEIGVKKAGNLDEVIALLPESLRRNFALQYESHGLMDSSLQFPRPILFGQDAKFIVTFNGEKSQAMYDVLEIMQFNDQSKQFELFALSFDAQQNLKVEKNPAVCLSCHSNTAGGIRPFWQDYDGWTGFFGSMYDAPKLVSREETGLREFNRTAAQHSRYKSLLYHPSQVSQEMAPFYDSKREDGGHGDYESMPNARLMDLLYGLNSVRLVDIFQKHPHYRELLPLLIYFVDGDAKDFDFLTTISSYSVGAAEVRELKITYGLFLKRLYAFFGRTPPDPNKLTLSKSEFFGLFGLSGTDFTMRPGLSRSFKMDFAIADSPASFFYDQVFNDFISAYGLVLANQVMTDYGLKRTFVVPRDRYDGVYVNVSPAFGDMQIANTSSPLSQYTRRLINTPWSVEFAQNVDRCGTFMSTRTNMTALDANLIIKSVLR